MDGLEVSNLRNLTLVHFVGHTYRRSHLESIEFALNSFNTILISSEEVSIDNKVVYVDMLQHDSQTLVTLLNVRLIVDKENKKINTIESMSKAVRRKSIQSTAENKNGKAVPNRVGVDNTNVEMESFGDMHPHFPLPGPIIVSEVLDPRTKPLISVASVTDYVTSNELVQLLIYYLLMRIKMIHVHVVMII